MPGSIHEGIVLHDLVGLGGCTKLGFHKAARDVLSIQLRQREDDFADVCAVLSSLHPDAFRLDSANQALVCYEVEVGHPLSEEQLRAYVYAWELLDGLGGPYRGCWQVFLIRVDRYGNQTPEHLVSWRHRFRAVDALVGEKVAA